MTHRPDDLYQSDPVEQVAGLVELSSLGTVGARQLRDRTSSASRDRALVQAYFSATAEGSAWWRANGKDATALYDAAQALAADGPEERAISARLMNLAAAFGHTEAGAIMSGNSEQRPAGMPMAAEALPRGPAGRADRKGHRPGSGSGMDWRSFEKFFVKFLDPLTATLSAEMSLRAERSRATLVQAMKAAFDNWECISSSGRPEEWVLGYAVRLQRHDLAHDHRSWCILVLDCCSSANPALRRGGADSGADAVLFGDVDVRITGAMMTAVQSKARTGAHLPPPVDRLVFECKQYLADRHTEAIAEIFSPAALDEAITGFCSRQFRSAVHLATLLVGESDPAEEIAIIAFNSARRAWRQGERSCDETAAALRQSLVNQARAADRFRKTSRLTKGSRAWYLGPGNTDEMWEELGPAVLRALQQLTVRQREALALRYYADLDIAQIADAMGISAPAACAHMTKGVRELQVVLGYPCPLPEPGQFSVDQVLERDDGMV